jgi:hypothetical protein
MIGCSAKYLPHGDVRARGAEVGFRTVRIRGLQSTVELFNIFNAEVADIVPRSVRFGLQLSF